MLKVGINGYGTIGKRVADAVRAQPDMEVVGVAKTQPNYEAHAAVRRGYPMYAAIPERAPLFSDAGIDTAGVVDELVADADDCWDAERPGENRRVGGAATEDSCEAGDPLGVELCRLARC